MVSRGLIEHYEEFQEHSSLCSSRLGKTIIGGINEIT